jgi:ATP-dependent protease ClpP protease subunit
MAALGRQYLQMGYFSDYINAGLHPMALQAERSKQLAQISTLRKRAVLVMAADIGKGRSPISIDAKDLTPLKDQLSSLDGDAIDLILETPGGSGETAEDIVKLLRRKYKHVGVIVPGTAKSAGTIMAMAADEILMEPVSALGPIDAQILWQGKVFSAGALIEKVEKIKEEVRATKELNKAYIPILQSVSPGELQNAENALEFAKILVRDWLVQYKFKDWNTHRSSGAAVTADEKKQRAADVAASLCDHTKWKTHGRSIHIEDLRAMRLDITDYTEQAPLCEAIQRYYALLQLTFEGPIYKIFETPTSRIVRMDAKAGVAAAPINVNNVGAVEVAVKCNKCGAQNLVAALFSKDAPVPADRIRWPSGDQLQCPKCKFVQDISKARKQIETQIGKRIS